ncbi:hypothetical protein [Thermoactinospora rubra]|uniref:hypothetical protein n=1 Tax=Thermoactinospora rubra TaxID=1088767 RepID=UPI000A105198|nr:hypothetical protein [Thermoactinospora rubra]
MLYWASVPYPYGIEIMLVGLLLGFPLLVTWLVRLALAAADGTLSAHRRRWSLPCLIVAGVVLALVTDAPFRFRFTVSEPAMEAFARTVAVREPPDGSCRWLGLYRVCWAWPYETLDGRRVPGSAVMTSREWAIESNTGFVWLPEGRPEGTMDDSYRHITGHWYGWHGWDSW